jgi:hypothetical protein
LFILLGAVQDKPDADLSGWGSWPQGSYVKQEIRTRWPNREDIRFQTLTLESSTDKEFILKVVTVREQQTIEEKLERIPKNILSQMKHVGDEPFGTRKLFCELKESRTNGFSNKIWLAADTKLPYRILRREIRIKRGDKEAITTETYLESEEDIHIQDKPFKCAVFETEQRDPKVTSKGKAWRSALVPGVAVKTDAVSVIGEIEIHTVTKVIEFIRKE